MGKEGLVPEIQHDAGLPAVGQRPSPLTGQLPVAALPLIVALRRHRARRRASLPSTAGQQQHRREVPAAAAAATAGKGAGCWNAGALAPLGPRLQRECTALSS
jgi:hypothetical protein